MRGSAAGVSATRPAAVLIPVIDRAGADGAAHAAHRRICATMPGRSRFPAARSMRTTPARSPPRCARRRRRSGLTARFIEPIGYLDLYLTSRGFRIVPAVARVDPGFTLDAQSRRGRRCVRGAARFPDGGAEPRAAQPRMEGHDAHSTTRCRSASANLGRDGRHSAQPVRAGLSRMIRPVLTEIALFLAPFVALCDVPVGDAGEGARPARPGRGRSSPG